MKLNIYNAMIDISVLWNQTGHTGQIKHVSFPSCTHCPMLKGQHDVKLTELLESLVVFELAEAVALQVQLSRR